MLKYSVNGVPPLPMHFLEGVTRDYIFKILANTRKKLTNCLKTNTTVVRNYKPGQLRLLYHAYSYASYALATALQK